MDGEVSYLNLMKNVLENGYKTPDRTGVGNIFLPGQSVRYDISNNIIPLFTSRKVPWKNVIHELLFFMKGHTDTKKHLESENVNIWKAHTSIDFLKRRKLNDRPEYKEGTMGPMYGFQWRHFGAEYLGPEYDYTDKGYDQLKDLFHNLKHDPYSRSHMITALNPSVNQDCVLCPCHFAAQWIVQKNKNENEKDVLHVIIYQRSADLCLGVPTNVASYSTLTHILGHYTNLQPGTLTHFMGHAHIYENQIPLAKEHVKRTPSPHPTLKLINMPDSFEDLSVENFQLENYKPQSFIKYPFAT
jgi:thymidylate synthase